MIEDEMVGWHHQPNGHEFEQALGVGDGQYALVLSALFSCIEPGLAIYFTYNTRFNAILSNLTLAFSHRVQQSFLYICVSFAVSHIGSLLPSF